MLTHQLPLWPWLLSIQPPNQIRSNAVSSTHLTVESLSVHFTQALMVHSAAIRQPVDVWHLTLCVMVYSVFHYVLVTVVGGQLQHWIGSLRGQRYFCSVVKKKMEKKKKSLRFTNSYLYKTETLADRLL